MDKQQKKDYYYGYNLRLADELGEFDEHINQPASLKGKKELARKLEEKLLGKSCFYPGGYTEEQLYSEVFNPEEIEQ